MKNFITFTLDQILLGDQIKKNEMGRIYSMHRQMRNE